MITGNQRMTTGARIPLHPGLSLMLQSQISHTTTWGQRRKTQLLLWHTHMMTSGNQMRGNGIRLWQITMTATGQTWSRPLLALMLMGGLEQMTVTTGMPHVCLNLLSLLTLFYLNMFESDNLWKVNQNRKLTKMRFRECFLLISWSWIWWQHISKKLGKKLY